MKESYQQRALEAAKVAAAKNKKLIRFGLLRLLLFIGWILLLILLFQLHWLMGLVCLVVGISAFIMSISFFQHIEQEKLFNQRLETFNKNELQYLELELTSFDKGEKYTDVVHPYSNDLDVFGNHSLFQMLNRSKQKESMDLLAKRLQTIPAFENLLARQAFVKELRPKLDFMQSFLCLNQDSDDGAPDQYFFKNWLNESILSEQHPWLKVAGIILPIINVLATLGFFADFLNIPQLLFIWLPTFMIEGFFIKRIQTEINYFGKVCKILSRHIRQVELLEKQSFTSEKGRALLSSIHIKNQSPSKIFKQALRIRDQFEVRYNFLVFPVLVLLFWEFHWLRKSAGWKKEYAETLINQLQVVYEVEVFCCLGIFARNNPSFVFPTITKDNWIKADKLGNPLLLPKNCVTNDVQLPTQAHIKLLTGSNMAGKSTFLRSIGCNMVLAYQGAPVFASQFELPILNLITSMRTVDSLMDSTSSFWAELKRLKQVLELVQSGKPVYFLLDEILKGTNSRDRHTGNRAFILQLLEHGGAGIIATHDLELTDLEEKTDGKVENVCIEVAIEDGKMYFDRKLKKGYSQSFNATLLMKQIGINIPLKDNIT